MSVYFSSELLQEQVNDHYYFEKYEYGFRVVTKFGMKYAFSFITKEQFEQKYKKYWNSIVVSTKKEEYMGKEILFSEEELSYIKQQIILHWMYFYSVNKMEIDIKKSDLNHGQTWDEIRWMSQKKYKSRTKEADIAASNTIGIDLNEYIEWRKSREYLESLR